MKKAVLFFLISAFGAVLAAAEPKAELLTEPLHNPIAADIEELPSDGKIGDFFNVRSVTDDAVTVQFGIRLPAETGITVRLIQGGKTLAALGAQGRFGRILFSGLEPDTVYTVSAEYDLFSAEPEAVKINAGRAKLEASGGITLERLPRIGRIGVDFVSSGALTHSVKAADISLDIVAENRP